MTIGRKTLTVFLAILLIVLGTELAVQHFSDFKTLRMQITSQLAERLQADVEIDRMGLDVLPWPHLELRQVRMDFSDGSLLQVPVINLSPTLKGLFAGRPEVVSISLEKPEVQIVFQAQKAESDILVQKARRKEQAAYIDSLLQAIPSGIKVHDGTLQIKAPGAPTLVLEDVEAKAEATPKGLRISADCKSSMWQKLEVALTYRDPAADLSLKARHIDIVKTNTMLNAFAGEDIPAADIRQNASGMITSVSLTVGIPQVSEPSENITISGKGSFKDIDAPVPDMDIEVRELAGDFEFDKHKIVFTGIDARVDNARLRDADVHLDGARGFVPELIIADIKLDLADVPGLLHLIPDPDVREEIAMIKNPTGTARATVEIRAEEDSYSAEVALRKLVLQSSYRSFPSTLELRRGTCNYRDEVLSLNGFSGTLGSSVLPDFSLSFGLGSDKNFTAAAKGAVLAFDDLNTVLASFESSRNIIDDLALAGGYARIENLVFEGPLTEPKQWEVSVDALLDNVSIKATGFDGPFKVRSSMLRADQHTCTFSRADITYREAQLAGTVTLKGYLDGIRGVVADVRGVLGKQTLAGLQEVAGLPSVLALKAPVKFNTSRFAWSRGGAITFSGDFTLGEKTTAGLKLGIDNGVIDIEELRITDKASQCRLGMKIEEDVFSFSYEGMLKKDTLDRVLLNNSFLQGWLEGDISVLFNQKNPRRSSAKGKLAWEKAGFFALANMPITLTSAEVRARDRLLTIGSAGLSTGLGSAGVQGSIGFTDEAFVLDLVLEAARIDVDAFTDRLFSDNAKDSSNAEEFWKTPLRGTVRLTAQEITKDSFTCKPFEALVTFADRAVTVNTEGTIMCGVALPATVRISPGMVSLEARPKAEKIPLQGFEMCLYGDDDLMTGKLNIDAALRAQAPPDALLDSLAGDFTASARNGRIYRSGLIAKIISFLSIRNILQFSIRDMRQSGYDYQSLDIDGVVKGQTLEIDKCVLISTSFTLVCKGTINLKNETVDLDALVTPFQIHNQALSKIPLVGKSLSKPMLGIPLKISGSLGDVQISTRTTSAVTKSLSDITRSVIKLPVRIIRPVLPGRSSEEQ